MDEHSIDSSYNGSDPETSQDAKTGKSEEPPTTTITTTTDNASSSSPSKKVPVRAKKEKSKYKKNPNAPKRFRSAFIMFSQQRHSEIREQLKAEDSETNNLTGVAKMVSQEWRDMDPKEREHWQELARQDMVRFEEEKAQFKGSWRVPADAWQKDPTRPRKPAPAYFAFSNARRQQVKQENPNATNAEVSKILSKMWQETPEETRQQYIDEETRQREIYVTKLEEWRKTKDIEPEAEEPPQATAGDGPSGNSVYHEVSETGSQSRSQGQHHSPGIPNEQKQQQQAQMQAQQHLVALLGRHPDMLSTFPNEANPTRNNSSSVNEMTASTAVTPAASSFPGGAMDNKLSQQQSNAASFLQQIALALMNQGGTTSEPTQAPQPAPQTTHQAPQASNTSNQFDYQQPVPPQIAPQHQENSILSLQQALSLLQGTQNTMGDEQRHAQQQLQPQLPMHPSHDNRIGSSPSSSSPHTMGAATLNALFGQSLGGRGGHISTGLKRPGIPHRVSPQPPTSNEEADPNVSLLRLLMGGANASQQLRPTDSSMQSDLEGSSNGQYGLSVPQPAAGAGLAEGLSAERLQGGAAGTLPLFAHQQQQQSLPQQNAALESVLRILLLPQAQQQEQQQSMGHQQNQQQQQQQQSMGHQQQFLRRQTHQQQLHAPQQQHQQPPPAPERPSNQESQQQMSSETANLLALTQLLIMSAQQQQSGGDGSSHHNSQH